MGSSLNLHTPEIFGAQDPDIRCCDWPGCRDEGRHRAPKSRKEIETYHWFCLGHVRQYNKGWNYYAGMSDAEVEADVRYDTVWHRPSWPLGGNVTPDDVIDNFGEFGPEWNSAGGATRPPDGHAKPGTRQAWAVAVFSLSGPVNNEAAKSRYKELVKQHHPDTNGGDKAAEEKIKEINEAYQIIMEMLAS